MLVWYDAFSSGACRYWTHWGAGVGGRQFSMVDGRQFPAVLSRDQNGAVRRHAEVLNREHLEPIGVHPRTVGFRPRTVYRYGGGKVALLESGVYVGPYSGSGQAGHE